MKFSWDKQKEKINWQKHKVAFIEACYIFTDKYSLTIYDKNHSIDEDRWITLGQTPQGKLLLVVHTYRSINNEEQVRIISARKATKKEIKQYFERKR